MPEPSSASTPWIPVVCAVVAVFLFDLALEVFGSAPDWPFWGRILLKLPFALGGYALGLWLQPRRRPRG